MASVFKNKKMDCIDTIIFTHGFLLQMMVVVESQEPRQTQSSMARPISSVWELSGVYVSMSQCVTLDTHGLMGPICGLGHSQTQCPVLPHLKHRPDTGLFEAQGQGRSIDRPVSFLSQSGGHS